MNNSDEIIWFPDEETPNKIIKHLNDCIKQRGFAYVDDFFDMFSDVDPSVRDILFRSYFGWDPSSEFKIEQIANGYLLILPEPTKQVLLGR